MTSLLTSMKQIPANAGYYINVGDCSGSCFGNLGTNDVPQFSVGAFTSSVSTVQLFGTLVAPGTAVFRDHGVTLVSTGRVFRKVQLLAPTGSVLNGGTDGVTQVPGSNPTSYLTGYIELPGTGGMSSGSSFTPVARLG